MDQAPFSGGEREAMRDSDRVAKTKPVYPPHGHSAEYRITGYSIVRKGGRNPQMSSSFQAFGMTKSARRRFQPSVCQNRIKNINRAMIGLAVPAAGRGMNALRS